MRRHHWLILLLPVLLFMMAACAPVSDQGDPLAGTNWLLSSLNGRLPVVGTTVTLQFGDGDGTAFGSDGCNRFTTTAQVEGSSITIGPNIAGTMMACEPRVQEQATAFTDALVAANSFEVSGDVLTLSAGRRALATFVRQDQSLAGTFWQVTNFNNGREAVVGILEGTEITARFGTDNVLSGNAGCNEYSAPYSADEGNLVIGPVALTLRFCEAPEGVMDQEQQYLEALASATVFNLEGSTLSMRTAADALAVVMALSEEISMPAPEAQEPTAVVTSAVGVNVRSGPGTTFAILGVAPQGTSAEVVGRSVDGQWWAVVAPTGPNGTGWVTAANVEVTNGENVPVIEVAAPPAPPATATPVPVSTNIPIIPATATPLPSTSFTADRTTINRGECTTLRWAVENVAGVWVYAVGDPFQQFPRQGQGTWEVCPTTTTTYEMRVQLRDGSVTTQQITITVNQPAATAVPPTATPVPPTATPVPPTATPVPPTATPVPPTATPVPVSTEVPPVATDPLNGTQWQVVGFNNGAGAIRGAVEGTSPTVSFSAGITGVATGCNQFSGGYVVNDASISIGPLAGGKILCESPEGVMEQEQQLTAALQTAATFAINGNALELRRSDGSLAVTMNR